MITYQNGNYTVSINEKTGTKIREFDSIPNPIYPEAIDLKITDYCDLGCPYCHEGSSIYGKHADLDYLFNILKDLPAGTEISVGGGNCLKHPELIPFLYNLTSIGLIPNITVNALHLNRYQYIINFLQENKLIYGLGITYNKAIDLTPFLNSNTVIHLVLGVHTIDDMYDLISKYENLKVLLLGYKTKGRGINYKLKIQDTLEDNIYQWYTNLYKLFKASGLTLSFDNLAISQLDVERFFEEEQYNTFYMGDDGLYTMYIDGVSKEFSISSTNPHKNKIKHSNIKEIFHVVRHGA